MNQGPGVCQNPVFSSKPPPPPPLSPPPPKKKKKNRMVDECRPVCDASNYG